MQSDSHKNLGYMKKINYTPKVQVEVVQRFGKGPVPIGTKAWTPVVTEAPVRVTSTARSVSTPGGSTALKPNPQYTGGNVLGSVSDPQIGTTASVQ